MYSQNTDSGIAKLEGQQDLKTWIIQELLLLKGQNLYKVLRTAVVKPENDNRRNKNSNAQPIINTKLSEKVLIQVLTCENARDLWNKLICVYEKKSSSSLHSPKHGFFQFKFGEGLDVCTLLFEIQELETLKHAGKGIPNQLLITKVLMSLPSNLKYSVPARESVEPTRLPCDELVSRLIVEKIRRKAKSDDNENAALYVEQGLQQEGGQVKCFGCGLLGRYVSKRKRNKEYRKYFLLKQHPVLHPKLQCPKGVNDLASDKTKKAFPVALLTDIINLVGIQSDKWLLDSGANEHNMAFDQKLFSKYKGLLETNYVIVGDERYLPVFGNGDVLLMVFDGKEYKKTTIHDVLYVPNLKVNLFLMPTLTNKGFEVTLTKKCSVYTDSELCLVGSQERNCFVMNFKHYDSSENGAMISAQKSSGVHRDLGQGRHKKS